VNLLSLILYGPNSTSTCMGFSAQMDSRPAHVHGSDKNAHTIAPVQSSRCTVWLVITRNTLARSILEGRGRTTHPTTEVGMFF
jgi:hypothetical protein